MITLSNRINKIEGSGIRKIFDLAASGKGEFINLSIGQPHFETPHNLKKAAQDAIGKNMNAYTPTMGMLELREKIALKLKTKNHIDAKADDIIVTSGTSGGILLSLSALVDPGDEVILPDPYFVLYEQILRYLDAKPVYLDTYPDFRIKAEKLEPLISRKTKAIILNSPNNPTGMVYGRHELLPIAELVEKNGITIISDEIYEAFDYETKFMSMGSIYENTITLNGFSKSHSITGWRIGYAHSPSKIIGAMSKLQQYTFVCAPSFAQCALNENWDNNDLENEIAAYKYKRDIVVDKLKDKYEFNVPEGAFYAFIKIPEYISGFIDKAIQKKLLIVPGDVFSQKSGYFRISFAVTDKELTKGLEILNEMV